METVLSNMPFSVVLCIGVVVLLAIFGNLVIGEAVLDQVIREPFHWDKIEKWNNGDPFDTKLDCVVWFVTRTLWPISSLVVRLLRWLWYRKEPKPRQPPAAETMQM